MKQAVVVIKSNPPVITLNNAQEAGRLAYEELAADLPPCETVRPAKKHYRQKLDACQNGGRLRE